MKDGNGPNPRKGNSASLAWQGKGVASRQAGPVDLIEMQGDAEAVFIPRWDQNLLIHGDNLEVARALLDHGWAGQVDLIYIDPPFWTGDTFSSTCGEMAYSDTWGGSIDAYLDMIHPRLVAVRELLSPAGSAFVHVDWHANHYIKVLMDEVFGRQNLVNEIAWHYGGPSPVKTSFPRKHDTILFYAKSADYVFVPQYEPIKQYLVKRARRNPDGRQWVDQNVGKITSEAFDKLRAEDRVFLTRTGRYRRKQYLDEMHGDMVDDVWTIPIINSQAKERTGFPTQKPLSLLERIVACASRPGAVVVDLFCGSGTTLVAAGMLGRSFVGVDSSVVAIDLAGRRLREQGIDHARLAARPRDRG